MRKKLAVYAAVFAAFWTSGGPLYSSNVLDPHWIDIASGIRPIVESGMAEAAVAGCALVVVDRNEVVWSEGFGYTDRGTGKRADADSMFEIGSVSKTFTGLMVMRLAEEGRLDIDRPVADYIPEFRLGPPIRDFPRVARPITIRDMLTHHSGIPGDLFNGAFATRFDPGYSDRILDWLAGDSATYPPGYRWAYSNTAFALLGDVIQAASGRPFKEYSDEFLASLGMEPASYFKDDPALLSRLSEAYDGDELLPRTYINIPAAGSIAASVNHMARYLQALLAGGRIGEFRIVEPGTFASMTERQYPEAALDPGNDMGLSFLLSDPEFEWAGSSFWHNGATLAFRSHMEILPDQELAVFVVANSTGGGALVEKVAKSILTVALAGKRGMRPPEPARNLSVVGVPLASLHADVLAGVYVNDGRGHYQILTPRDGGLSRRTVGADGAREEPALYLFSDGRFRTSEDAPVSAEFVEIAGRSVIVNHAGSAEGIGGELFIPDTIPASWISRLGSWTPIDLHPDDVNRALGTIPSLRLETQDGLLLLRTDEMLYVLEPVSDTTAVVRGLGRAGGSSLRVVPGSGEEHLRFLMLRYRRE